MAPVAVYSIEVVSVVVASVVVDCLIEVTTWTGVTV
jgi:hypothetical protein